jgi:hypothetical protein
VVRAESSDRCVLSSDMVVPWQGQRALIVMLLCGGGGNVQQPAVTLWLMKMCRAVMCRTLMCRKLMCRRFCCDI